MLNYRNIDVSVNSPALQEMERCVDNIQKEYKVDIQLHKIAELINRDFPNIVCERVLIFDNNTKDHFFGARIMPTYDELDRLSDEITADGMSVKNLSLCKRFVIEIDSKLLYKIGATPDEVVAAIIHEIGHKIFSDQVYGEIKQNLNSAIIKERKGNVVILDKILSGFRSIRYNLYTFLLMSYSKVNLFEEIEADNLAHRCGYASSLHSLLQKIKTAGDRKIDIQDEEKELVASWTVRNMMNFSMRRNNVISALKEQIREEKSEHIKAMLEEQLRRVTSAKLSANPNLSEEALDILISESVKTFFEIRKKGYSQLELDELEMEIDDIDIAEDKIYIITRIHKDIQTAIITKKKKDLSDYENTMIDDFIAKLRQLLEKTKKVKIAKKDYSVIIKYPENDYENL